MAVAPEALAAAEDAGPAAEESAARSTRPAPAATVNVSPGGSGRAAFDNLPSGGHAGGLGIGVRLVWAVAAGLLVLELLSLASGRYWTWNLKGGLSSLKSSGTYLGLYPGQTAKLSTMRTVTSAMPGVLPNTTGNTAPQAGAVIGPTP